MSDRWIVTGHPFVQHKTLEKAMKESARLTALTGKSFSIMRVKSQLAQGGTYLEMIEALKLALTIIGHPDDAGTKFIAEVLAKATGEP